MNNLNLKKFDMNSLRSSSNCIIIGKRASGKAYLARDILRGFDLQYEKDISPAILNTKYSAVVKDLEV